MSKEETKNTKKVAGKTTTTKKSTTAKKSTSKKATTKKNTTNKTTSKKPVETKTTKKAPVKKEAEVKKIKVIKEESKVEEKSKNNSTKALIIAILVLTLFGILFAISENKNEKFVEPETFSEEEQAELKNITVDDYLALKAGSDVSVIYIARPTCSHCVVQTPRMKYIKYKYGVEINYLNTDEFDEEGTDYDKLVASDDFFDEGFGTPTILIVQNDKIIDSVSGESEISDVVELFKTHELIKE
ncbi:MAG: thioredoxin family protein [Bacilli bacterium]